MTIPTRPPVGPAVPGWSVRPTPEAVHLQGRYASLRPLTSASYSELYAALGGEQAAPRWTYLPAEPPRDLPSLWMLMSTRLEADPATFAVVGEDGRVAGTFALCTVDESNGSVELGWVLFGEALARTRAATEAVHLVQSHVFEELGYRRLEWKCDSLNEPSRRAALRFGFTYEGTFRQHRVVKGHNRDSAWFSITDSEWPAIRERQLAWLDPENFDADGVQRTSLRPHGSAR
ncbi:GNAT family N-acetyltransferase [Nocardioides jiangxiensis]|uniref:GNAT family protein n=1 Tax=Nocardioides jiangxiensis TaxID=3064524 RepID=A0ABT9B335_9ACTN|nr:GNAT family protein [Nocardioides sp. WY-20]MDO7869108.1 GNAT family protein [Nocardioides sp. WY-20]